MKTKILASLSGLVVSLLTPLAVLVPQASAASITWSGGGTAVEDSVAKTRTFNISDTANWVGGVAPVAGDSLVFPANLAPVDPTSAVTDDYAWSYIVNNDLTAGTDIAGITFTGDTGTDCAVVDDVYTFGGNEISLSGDVVNSYTGSCINSTNRFDMPIVTTASITFDANLYNYYVTSVASLNYGANNFSFCDVADGNRSSKQSSVYDAVITGTGTLSLACSTNYLDYAYTSTVGSIVVESNSSVSGNLLNLGKEVGKSFTLNAGATFSLFNSAEGTTIDFKRNIVFVGAGSTTTYCKSTTCSGADSVSVGGYRGGMFNSKYNPTLKKYDYFPITISGDVTLSADTTFSLTSAKTTITGAISGNFALSIVPGSRGDLILQSSDNQSATANGTIKPSTIDYKMIDLGYSPAIQYGYIGVLTEAEIIDDSINVMDGGTLKGVGTVAGINVQSGGALAPGNSPGCIVSTGDLTLAGSYDVELAGTTVCTEYDQTDVTGAVDVTGATLNTSFLNSFVPALNNEFVIIKNDASDAVTGEFTGMADGSSFDVAGVTFQINYDGGDGNDVVLTATAVPATVTTPDTGIGQLLQSPLLTLTGVLLSAGMLVGIKRMQSAK